MRAGAPAPPYTPQGFSSWRAFIRNPLDSTAAIDFFTPPTITRRVLYVFLMLGHPSRNRPRTPKNTTDPSGEGSVAGIQVA